MRNEAEKRPKSGRKVPFPTCARCGKTLPRDVGDVDPDGANYCDECHNDPQTIMCRGCGGYVPYADFMDENGLCPICSGS